jgi:hypothetical protein
MFISNIRDEHHFFMFFSITIHYYENLELHMSILRIKTEPDFGAKLISE